MNKPIIATLKVPKLMNSHITILRLVVYYNMVTSKNYSIWGMLKTLLEIFQTTLKLKLCWTLQPKLKKNLFKTFLNKEPVLTTMLILKNLWVKIKRSHCLINNFNKLKTNFKRKISTKLASLALLRTKETSFQEIKLEKHFQIILQWFNQFNPNWINGITDL